MFLVRPGAPSSVLVTTSKALVTSSILAPSSDARSPRSFLLLVVRPGTTSSDALVTSSVLVTVRQWRDKKADGGTKRWGS